MTCCYTSKKPLSCHYTFTEMVKAGLHCQVAMIMVYLGIIVTPEPTNIPQVHPDTNDNRVLGAVKALVWVMVSVGIGIVLATVFR